MTARTRTFVLLVVLCLLLPACGETERPVREEEETVTPLPDVPDTEKARFALERFLKGPLPRTGRFAIPKLHSLNLQHARADLEALGPETATLLSNPDLITRLTRPDGDHNPWHNVLSVLARIRGVPAAVVAAWSTPAFDANDLPLDRQAVNALAEMPDDELLAPILLRFLERRPRDRELAPRAAIALLRRGSPWRERALATAWRAGTKKLWDRISVSLSRDASGADALAFWALLVETCGPSQERGTVRNLVVPWWAGRLLVDDAVWPEDPAELEVAMREGRALAPAYALDGGGFLVKSPDASPVLAWRQVLTSGDATAAMSRCSLAVEGHAPYEATLARDLAGNVPEITNLAALCLGSEEDGGDLEISHAVLDAFLEDLAGGLQPLSTGIQTALEHVSAASPEDGADIATRILRDARPGGAYQALLEFCHDALYRADPDALRAEVKRLTNSDVLEDGAVGRLLIRRARDPAYAEDLLALVDRADPSEVPALRRLLIWLHSDPERTSPEARKAFARHYAAWIDESGDQEAGAIASGLLDLGASGAEAYAAGLRGPRRHVFVLGLLGRTGLVPLPVAVALLEPVDASTPAAERHAVLVAAYRSAPGTAAPYLAAARERLAPAARDETDDVLEVLRHRAAR